MATAHLKECVQLLVKEMYGISSGAMTMPRSVEVMQEGLTAAFELIDQPWSGHADREVLIWQDGYEQCMKDIVDAIADEWGVTLPPDPLRSKENSDEGAGQ